MRLRQFTPLADFPELIVDNFAGGGGASLGIEMALGRHVDLAVNHDPEAIAMHAANHPRTRHLCENVLDVDPLAVTEGRPVGIGWFSPDCTDHSKAKGGRPRRKYIRALAWVMVKWAEQKRPRNLYLENVEEFQGWGPLLPNGMRCPLRKGHTFKRFVRALRKLGYTVEWKEIRGCWFGAPTIRKRLFLIARCDGAPITWAEITHGHPDSEEVKSGKLKPWPLAADCIDFSIPCPSIFLTKKEARAYGVKRPLVKATMRRIARGIFKFVISAKDPFIVNLTHQGNGDRTEATSEPFRTITGAHGGEKALIAPHITKFRTGSIGSAATEPFHTITAGPKDRPAGAAHAMGLVSATLVPRYGERKGQAPRARSIKQPMPAVVPTQNGAALVQAFLTEHANASTQRIFDLQQPLRTQCAEVKGGHFALVAANVVRHFGESTGSDCKAPLGTVVAGGMGKTGIVTSHLAKLYGTATGQNARDAMHTITSGGNHIAEVRALLIKFYGEGGQDQSCAEPMHTIPTKDRIGLVIVHGEIWQISDIGMRMLEPFELYLAQGFPPTYIINFQRWVNRRGKLVLSWLPKHSQVRMCGNSVNPPVVKALIAANNPEMIVHQPAEAAA